MHGRWIVFIDACLQALKGKLAIYEFISSHPLSVDIGNATYTRSVNLVPLGARHAVPNSVMKRSWYSMT